MESDETSTVSDRSVPTRTAPAPDRRYDCLDDAARLARRYLDGLGDRPVTAAAGLDELRAVLTRPLPDEGEDPSEVVESLARDVEPGLVASGGPRYFGFVIGGAVPAAVAADWLVSTWDQNCGGFVAAPALSVVGLALAMAVGAVAVAPLSLAAAGPALFSPAVLVAGAAVAALSSLLPYALEAISLRLLPSSTSAVLMSLAPAVAAITGAVLLGQRIDASGGLAIACVVAASAGAVATSVPRAHRDHRAPRPSAQPSSLPDRRAVS